jgi:hypothetical protein
MHQMSIGMCRLIATIGRTQLIANMLCTTILVPIYIFGGVFISKGEMTLLNIHNMHDNAIAKDMF